MEEEEEEDEEMNGSMVGLKLNVILNFLIGVYLFNLKTYFLVI